MLYEGRAWPKAIGYAAIEDCVEVAGAGRLHTE